MNLNLLDTSTLNSALTTVKSQISKYTALLKQIQTQYANCMAKINKLKLNVGSTTTLANKVTVAEDSPLPTTLTQTPDSTGDVSTANSKYACAVITKDAAQDDMNSIATIIDKLKSWQTSLESALTAKTSITQGIAESNTYSGAKSTLQQSTADQQTYITKTITENSDVVSTSTIIK